MQPKKDKRRFTRYKHKTDFYLSYKNTSIKAWITDYSLQGIGFLIDTPPSTPLETDVHFHIHVLQADGEGKIIWSETSDSQIRGGIEIKEIRGSLRHYPLADILIDLQRSLKTGALDIRSGPFIRRIYIRNGALVFATSNKEEDRFVEVLLRTGKITSDQYHQITDRAQKKGGSHSEILIELGYLSSQDIIQAIQHQVETIILSLFHLEDGAVTFVEGPMVSEKAVKLRLNAADIIFRGIKTIRNPQHIENVMPPADTIPVRSIEQSALQKDIVLEKPDSDILELIDGKRTIKEILSASPTDAFRTIKTLYALLSLQIVEMTETEPPVEEKPHDETVTEPEHVDDPDFVKRVEELYGKIDSSDYYSILGVEKWATLEQIKKAYHKAAREFHPDRHSGSSSSALKMKLNTTFSRLTDIYKILSDSKLRMEYDQRLTQGPDTMRTDNIAMARAAYREGKEAFHRGMYAEAKELFGRAVYLDSSVPNYHYYLGLIYQKEKRFHEAGKIMTEALKLDPNNSEYLAALGHLYIHLGFPLRAKSAFEKAIRNDPRNKKALEGLQKVKAVAD